MACSLRSDVNKHGAELWWNNKFYEVSVCVAEAQLKRGHDFESPNMAPKLCYRNKPIHNKGLYNKTSGQITNFHCLMFCYMPSNFQFTKCKHKYKSLTSRLNAASCNIECAYVTSAVRPK